MIDDQKANIIEKNTIGFTPLVVLLGAAPRTTQVR